MNVILIVTLFWLTDSFLADDSLPIHLNFCKHDIPSNVVFRDFKLLETETLPQIYNTIECLSRNLSSALESLDDVNLSIIMEKINNLNSIISLISAHLDSDLKPSVDALNVLQADLISVVNCFDNCTTTTTTNTEATVSSETSVFTSSNTASVSAWSTTTNLDVCSSDRNPCMFGSTCALLDGSVVCICAPYFNGTNCTEYYPPPQILQGIAGSMSTISDSNTPYTLVVEEIDLIPFNSSYYYTISMTSLTLTAQGDYFAVSDSVQTLENFTYGHTGLPTFNSSVGSNVTVQYRGSTNSEFLFSFSRSVGHNPCDGVSCGEHGECVISPVDPTQYACSCDLCYSGDTCGIDNTNPDSTCTQLGGNDFCNNQGGGCCYWGPCSTDIPKCSIDYC